MGNLQDIADRHEIEALRGECSDAAMMRDYDRFASLFTQDGRDGSLTSTSSASSPSPASRRGEG